MLLRKRAGIFVLLPMETTQERKVPNNFFQTAVLLFVLLIDLSYTNITRRATTLPISLVISIIHFYQCWGELDDQDEEE